MCCFVAGIGNNTSEGSYAQTLVGKFTAPTANTLFAVGNGSGDTPSNAFEVDKDGNGTFANSIKVTGIEAKVIEATYISCDSNIKCSKIDLKDGILVEGLVTERGTRLSITADAVEASGGLYIKDMLKIGNTTLTEAQLQKMIDLIDTIE
jgi:hypothetical protein